MLMRQTIATCLAAAAVCVVFTDALHGQHMGHGGMPPATQVLASLDDKGSVVVREFYLGFPPIAAPKKTVSLIVEQPKKQPPMPTIQENRFAINAKDLLVYGLDGKLIDAAVWRKALAKEQAVLFAGFRQVNGIIEEAPKKTVSLVPPQPKKVEAPIKPPVMPSYYKDVFKADTLVLYVNGDDSVEITNPPVKGDAPKGQAPQITLGSYQDGTLRLRHVFDEWGQFLVKVQEKDKDGKIVEITITIKETSQGSRTREIPAKYTKAFDSAGKAVALAQMQKLLAKEKGVVESMSGTTVDPFYLRLVRPDALVLAVPQPTIHYGSPESGFKESLPPPK